MHLMELHKPPTEEEFLPLAVSGQAFMYQSWRDVPSSRRKVAVSKLGCLSEYLSEGISLCIMIEQGVNGY